MVATWHNEDSVIFLIIQDQNQFEFGISWLSWLQGISCNYESRGLALLLSVPMGCANLYRFKRSTGCFLKYLPVPSSLVAR